MKRVTTTTNERGRSCVASIEELDPAVSHAVWEYEPDQVLDAIKAVDPAVAADWISPDVPGGSRWYFAPLPPYAEDYPGYEEDGFHTTRTVDFNFLFQGELTLVLDEDTVDLQPGDFIIQQATRHAWRNASGRTAVLICLIHRPEGV